MTLNVAYVALAPFISGSERSLQMILLNANKGNISPLLICPADSLLLKWAQENGISSGTCELQLFSLRKIFPWLYSQIKLIYLIVKYKINIVHSNQIWSYPAITLPAKITKCRTVCHLRDPVSESINWWLKSPPNGIVCVSKHTESELKKSYKKLTNVKLLEAIINPVNIPKRSDILINEDKNSFKANFNIAADTLTFGYVGQIAPVKGITDIIQTLAKLQSNNWMLLIAGEDPDPEKKYKQECCNLIDKHNLTEQVIFLGFQNDIGNFYQAVDCVLMFSQREPLGRVPLEAGAYFTPTMASNLDGLPETIEHNFTGFLVNREEHLRNSKTLDHTSQDTLYKMGFNARKFVEKHAAAEIYIQRLRKLYKYILNKQAMP